MPDKHTPTYGEVAVGIGFNPSGDKDVQGLKEDAAKAIDRVNALRTEATTAEQTEMYTMAQRKYQEGQMWAVKAATSPKNWGEVKVADLPQLH